MSKMNSPVQDRPVRVGVFTSMHVADEVVAHLLQAGLTVEQISVICSDEAAREHFGAFQHEEPAGTHTPAAAVAGSAIGAALGGLTAVALGVATGGVALLAAGGLALGTGGVVGGLIGAMLTRGVEKEAADFYDQAVTEGKILIAVEAHDDDPALARAEQIFAAAGSQPLPLAEQ